MTPNHLPLPVILLALLATTIAGARPPAPDGAPPDSNVAAPLRDDELVVSANREGNVLSTRVVIPRAELAARDPGSLADLAVLLPSTRLVVNSRGESLFMMRGAPERHLAVDFEGIPLRLAWDERSDLSLLPAGVVGRLRVSRGVDGVLDDPNTLAGRVGLLLPEHRAGGTRWTANGGQVGAAEGRLAHWRRSGDWLLDLHLSHGTSDAFVLPGELRDGAGVLRHQTDSERRLNSDRRRSALLLAGRRDLAHGGRLTLLLNAFDGEKGVPPETHRDDARFWRYPLQRRGLLGCAVELPLDERRDWRLLAAVSTDVFRQDIQAYTDASYTVPDSAAREESLDRTGHLRLRLDGPLGRQATAALQVSARYAHHRMSEEIDGPELVYSQWLGAAAAEVEWQPAPGWEWRSGAGYELAATPESGDKPGRDATDDVVLHGRLSRRLSPGMTAHLAASRRSRFPSLRELYSGALGRFVPNPDLRPERQRLAESGLEWRGRRWRLGLTGFVSRLDGGIEKLALPDRRFMRINRDRTRTLGLESMARWRPGPAFRLELRHTVLQARSDTGGGYGEPVEDRPDWLSSINLSGSRGAWSGQIEGVLLGPRHSADVTADGGLRRLPAWLLVNLRLGHGRPAPWSDDTWLEIFLRLNNTLDRVAWTQTGLPLAGRTLLGGVALEFGN